jgi:hypothetical protein
LRVSRRWLIVLLALVACISLAGAATYSWFLRITTPVLYNDSLQFWYTDETLNGEWIDVGVNQTTARPAVDLTKGVFDVEVLVNNTRLRPSGLRVEIKAVDTATSGVTNFIGFNVTGVGFSWGQLSWEQALPAESVTQWNIQYVLSEEAPLGYAGFSIEWTVNRFETVVQEELGFTTISVGSHSGYGSQANLVIQDSQAWIDLWNQHMLFMVEPLPVPEVDFSTNMVVAVFMGVVNTAGYALHIYEVVETESTIVVKMERTEPGPSCIVPQVLTQPYHMIQIARTEKPVTFEVTTRILECP